MNTVRSFWFGWGTLCAAGGAAYYFAKKSINADRQARLSEQRRKKSVIDALEQNGSPSSGFDPAPTSHAPTTGQQQVVEKSKYEASVPFQSPKGDRFS